MATDEQIGATLTRIRNGRSQKDVADAMRSHGFKWSQATVWAVEKGERPLRLTEAQALGVVLGINHDLLLAEPEELDLHADVADFTDRLEEIASLAYESYDAQRRLVSAIDDRPESERAGVTLSIATRTAIDAVIDGLARADGHYRRVSETGEWLDRRHSVESEYSDAFFARIREAIGSEALTRGYRTRGEDDGIDQAES